MSMSVSGETTAPLPAQAAFQEESDTIIIGAGPAGLAMGACLRRESVPFIILERSASVGAAWRNHYERLHLHTAKKYSGLPYSPFPGHYPTYVPRQLVVEYLESYATKFVLAPRFNEEVTRARRVEGRWEIETSSRQFLSTRLIVATGYNRVPVIPHWDGENEFTGVRIHSIAYRNAVPFRDRRVLVAGIGNTGAEIALDLLENGAKVSISVRGPVHFVPRDILGSPTQISGILLSYLPRGVAGAISAGMRRVIMGDLSAYGLRAPELSPFTLVSRFGKVPTIDVGTLAHIKSGAIPILPNIARFTPQGIEDETGAQHAFDAVILATGYKPGLADFLDEAPVMTDERGYPLALGREAAPGLYFIGYNNAPGGILRQIGIEAKAIARDIGKKGPAMRGRTAHA